jgi:hypothetical protein
MKPMLRNFFSNRIRPSHIIGAIFILTVLLISEYAMTWSGGKTGQTAKPGSGNGCTCHCANANNSTTVTVTTPATTFEGGQTYTFTVNVSSSDGNHSRAGFNVAVDRGTLNVGTDNTVQKIGDELTHTGPKALNATWTFTYTAPSTAGSATMYVTANAVNFDGGNGGGNCTDKWNHASNYSMSIVVPSRSLALTKSSVSLGNVRLGQTKSDTLSIISNGDAAITISSSAMKNTAPFSASPTGTNRSLSVGTQEVNTITFAPTTKAAFVDTFVVVSNSTTTADQRKTVVVTGTGIQAIFTGANSLPFGNVKVGQTKDLTYTYQNTGDDTLFVTGATLGSTASYSIQGPTAATILPGGNGSVTLRYSPTSRQTHSTQLTFTASNSIATPSVTLTGTGTSPQLSAPGLIQLGNIKLGAIGSQNLDIENIGNDTLIVTSVTIAPGFQGQKFSVSAGATGTILPGARVSALVGYQPTVLGYDTAKIIIASNDPQVPNREVLVTGRGALPSMKITAPDTIKFGDVRIGSSATNSTIMIENIGEAELAVTGVVASPSQFTVVTAPTIVGSHSTIPVQLKFTPTAEGVITGMVVISGDDAKLPRDTIYLSGRGTISQFDSPSEINFGDVKILTPRDVTFYLRNLGTATIDIASYGVTGPAGVFIVVDSSKHSIAPKDSIPVKLRFTPQLAQAYTGTFKVTTKEASNAVHTINLLGNGIDSKLALSTSSLDFGEVDTGKTSTKDLVITNTGNAGISINMIAINGSGQGAYALEHSTIPRTLQPNDTLLVHITFAPLSEGNHDAILPITPAEGPVLSVTLHGVGKVQPAESVRNAYQLDIPFLLSPNPSRGDVTATFELQTNDRIGFTIISIDGKLVQKIEAEELPAGKHELRLGTNALSNGEYIVRMENSKGQFIEERCIIIK